MPLRIPDAVRQRLAAEEPELRRRGVRHLAVFGSVARGDDRPNSDIDGLNDALRRPLNRPTSED